MLKTTLLISFLAVSCLPTTSYAAELSPWMGGENQTPFQLDPSTMAAANVSADEIETASTSKRECNLETCVIQPEAAKTPELNP